MRTKHYFVVELYNVTRIMCLKVGRPSRLSPEPNFPLIGLISQPFSITQLVPYSILHYTSILHLFSQLQPSLLSPSTTDLTVPTEECKENLSADNPWQTKAAESRLRFVV